MLFTRPRRHLCRAVGTWPFISMLCSILRGFRDEDLTYTSLSTGTALLIFDSLLKGFAALENFFTYTLKEQIFGDWKNMSILISIYWEKMPPFFSHGRWLFPHVSIECKPHKPQSCVTVSHKTSSCSSSGCGVCRGGWDTADPQCQDDSCGTFYIPFPVNLAEAN